VKTSKDRIITTHVGSMVRPPEIQDIMRKKEAGQPYDQADLEAKLKTTIAECVRRQKAIGIDVPSDGEFSKSSFSNYAAERLSGFSVVQGRRPITGTGRDRQAFPDFYAEYDGPAPQSSVACTGPVTYTGQAILQRDIANFKAATQAAGVEEAFIPAIAPGTMALQRWNDFYRSEEQYVFAVAEAMRAEYKGIVDAGFILQIDDPRMVTQFDAIDPEPSPEEYRKIAGLRIEALKGALAGLPADRMRYHMCWGSWHGPHSTDLPISYVIDLILSLPVGAVSFEAANPRHEHEWTIWEKTKLPGDMVMIPGVIAHTTNHIEHPELIAQRLVRFANLVGKERVMAGVDCGFSQGVFTQRVHPEIMWAKLESLAEGAKLASNQLWR
jgi:5-methyltetrahydropteroyltriglutamate--homocysteine methyltransferase